MEVSLLTTELFESSLMGRKLAIAMPKRLTIIASIPRQIPEDSNYSKIIIF